ncbi:DUF4377 domain-containing protein [Marinobacterium mangrovicola]|uniref:Uncharacterized protein DUF4377 n=1 Tax=Marinobacterium mangrovicola TaxID=1476959 RepID=A0A4R1GGK2_9GAMM|nr:DUF4377 domain-containing protein [Marinobacterium mangrovicola]TCK07607.1 uncharacterized protein DUF4377 [Marinobacterium mangrovicola]
MKMHLALAGAILLAGCTNTVETIDGAATQEMEFSVGPERVDCIGVGPMKCLVVNGSMFYDKIQGFEYEEGYQYRLKVARSERENPPADASRYEYQLIEITSKLQVMP